MPPEFMHKFSKDKAARKQAFGQCISRIAVYRLPAETVKQ
jgi:hypothetical protein